MGFFFLKERIFKMSFKSDFQKQVQDDQKRHNLLNSYAIVFFKPGSMSTIRILEFKNDSFIYELPISKLKQNPEDNNPQNPRNYQMSMLRVTSRYDTIQQYAELPDDFAQEIRTTESKIIIPKTHIHSLK
jgi:hypothetical protein